MKQRRQIELPPGIVRLENCTCPFGEYPEDTVFYAWHPFTHPSPCLAIVAPNTENAEWKGLIAVIPEDAPYKPEKNPAMISAVGLIATIGAPRIDAWKDSEIAACWPKLKTSEYPFYEFSPKDREHVLDRVKYSLSQSKPLSKEVKKSLREVEIELLSQTAPTWFLVRICEIEISEMHAENWTLLQNWERWSRIHPSIKEMAAEWGVISAEYSTSRKHLKKKKPGVIPSPGKRQVVDALRKRVRYLGLPSLVKEEKRKRRSTLTML